MFVLFVLIILLILYYYGTRNHSYWSKRCVKCEPPVPIFGNHFRNVFGIMSFTDIFSELYTKYPGEKYVGYYRGNTPELLIRDPDLARQILNVDFSHFYKRGFGKDPNVQPLHLNLFHVEGDKWKLLRQRLTPAFTTSKLKNMFPLVVRCAENLQKVAQEQANSGTDCDVKDLMARFTTDFIGACGFGIEMDSINNERSQFRQLGKLMFTPKISLFVLFQLCDIFPEITSRLNITNTQLYKDISEIFLNIRKQRDMKPIGRNDFIDLLLKLEMKGKIVGESVEHRSPDGKPLPIEMKLDLKCMAAQVFIFFAAGFETSSSATSFTLHQLAYKPDVQREIQEEIDAVLQEYDNKLCYDAVEKMKLLDMAFKEGMRMFPSLGCLHRVCQNKYTLPGTDVTIDKGVKVVIPIQAIQNDPQYFESPSEFRPRRFAPEEVSRRHKFVYLSFGEGPRACVGARLGEMQSLAGLAALLHKFSFEPAPSTSKQLQVNPMSNVVQGLKHGIPLRITVRKDKLV